MATLAERGSTARKKLTSGLLVGAVASGMVAASLSTTAPANAWCIGFSGLNFGTFTGGPNAAGGGCASQFGNFSLGLGETAVASSNGLFTGAIAFGNANADASGILTAAWAGGFGTNPAIAFTHGLLNWAMANGDGAWAEAGLRNADIANFAFNFGSIVTDAGSGAVGSNRVSAGLGFLNLAANFGGSSGPGGGGIPVQNIFAGDGIGNSALNFIGNRNIVQASNGFLLNATNIGSPFGWPNGSDNTVTAGADPLDPKRPLSILSVALNWQLPLTPDCVGPCGNTVRAGIGGSLAFAASIGQVKQNGTVNPAVVQVGPGINVNNIIKVATPLAAQAASATPQSLAAVSTGSDPGGSTASAGAKASSPNSVSNSTTKSTKKLSNAVSKIKSKRAE